MTATIYDRGAERLFEAVASTCEPEADFAIRVEAGLRSGLSFLAAEPGLARILTVRAGADEEILRRHQHWQQRFAVLLATAAPVLDSRADLAFREPTLIGGVLHLVAQQVLAGEAESLERQLPGLLEFVLVFYLDPSEVAPIARGAGTTG